MLRKEKCRFIDKKIQIFYQILFINFQNKFHMYKASKIMQYLQRI